MVDISHFVFARNRIVVLATPPFLVVHTNAAYCRLTGIDSHTIVGKPIGKFLSIDGSIQNLRINEGGSDDNPLSRNELRQPSLKDVTLEQLIATCGFGHTYTVQAHRKIFHQMVGRNVTVFKNDNTGAASDPGRDGEDSSNGARLTNHCDDGQNSQPFSCRIAIAPIVSSGTAMNYSTAVVDREAEGSFQKSKLAKHHHSSAAEHHEGQDTKQRGIKPLPKPVSALHHRKGYQPLHLVTHCVFQLQPHDLQFNDGSMESLSSNSVSVEARLLGLSKEQVRQQRDAVKVAVPHPEAEREVLDADESLSETTATKEPVATIG